MSEQRNRKNSRSRMEHMIATLRMDIITNKRKEGQFLPSERELAKQFHLSNKLVRLALEQLAAEGLIVKIPRVGNKIAESSPAKPVHVRFGYHSSLGYDAEIEQLLAAFHKRYPGIVIQPLQLSYDNYEHTVIEYMESGLLDVITMNFSNFNHFVTEKITGLLHPMDENPAVYPLLTTAFQHEGRLMVQPFIFSPLVICYNRRHLQELQLELPLQPRSWEELLHIASRLTVENSRFGFYYSLHSRNRWPVFLLQSGLKFHAEAGRFEEAVERIIEGLNLCREIIYAPNTFPIFLSESDADAEQLFVQEKVSVIMTSLFAMNRLKGSGIPFDVAPLPVLRENKTILLSIGLAISNKSEVKAAALKLVEFFLSMDAQSLIKQNTYGFPAVLDTPDPGQSESLYRPPHIGEILGNQPAYHVFQELNLNQNEINAIYREARMYWAKLLTEEELRDRISAILSKRGE